MMGTNRIAYLDLVKLLTIYLVILGHVIIMINPDLSVGGKLYTFIYTFHMPLFMVLSGFFVSSRSMKLPFTDLLKSKTRQLLLPVVSSTCICCLYLYLFRDNICYRNEIIGNSWFLKTLFVYYVLFYMLKNIQINDWVCFFCSCVVLFFIPHASSLQVNLLFPYFWGGYILKKNDVLQKLVTEKKYLAYSFIAFVVLYAIQLRCKIPIYIPVTIDTLYSSWHLILFRYAIGFSGCMSTILGIGLIYNHFKGDASYLDYIAKFGRLTLGVYVLQTILVINVFPDVVRLDIPNIFVFTVIIAPTIAMGFLLLCLWLVNLCSKNRLLDLFLFGGQYYNYNR